jgi:hypothetical protein
MNGVGHNQLSFQIQEAIVLAHLRDRGPLSPWEALHRYGIFRLAARVFRLRRDGHDILTRRVKNDFGNSYAEYHLIKLAQPKGEAA